MEKQSKIVYTFEELLNHLNRVHLDYKEMEFLDEFIIAHGLVDPFDIEEFGVEVEEIVKIDNRFFLTSVWLCIDGMTDCSELEFTELFLEDGGTIEEWCGQNNFIYYGEA